MEKKHRFLHYYETLEKYGGLFGTVYRRSLSLYFKYIRNHFKYKRKYSFPKIVYNNYIIIVILI